MWVCNVCGVLINVGCNACGYVMYVGMYECGIWIWTVIVVV